MRFQRKTVWRLVLAVAGLVLIAGLVAPRLNADRFGERVKASLHEALGREVEIGKLRLDLFSGPGFSAEKVIIHDDPAVSQEPFAYVESLEAQVSFKSLWTGRLEFSNLRLENASINLSRSAATQRWNFQNLVARTAGATARRGIRLPEIQLRGGRINFKSGDVKSSFYLSDTRLDATPPRGTGGSWRVRLEGQTTRTDRSTQGFGRFAVRGTWQPQPGSVGRVEATVNLERSSLSDLIRLIHGHDAGVHGLATTRTQLSGPLNDVRITGQVEIGDFHRWDLLPPHGELWRLDYAGNLDVLSQTLHVATIPPPGGVLPISLEVRLEGFLSQPRWGVLARFDRLPLAPLPELGRHMGLALPAGLALAGDLSGVIGYSPEGSLRGTVQSGETAVNLPGAVPIRLSGAIVVLDGNLLRLQPAPFELDQSEATIAGSYAWRSQTLDAIVATAGLPVASDQPGAARLPGGVPFLENCTKGVWKGQLQYHKEGDRAGTWAGTVQLAGAVLALPELADPLEIASARLALRDNGVVIDRIKGSAGAIEFTGEYRTFANADPPHQLQLKIAKLDAQELERLFMPLLHRDTLLARALRFGRTSMPAWLAARKAAAAVEIGTLTIGDAGLEKLRGRLSWEGAEIEVADLAARFSGGALAGRFAANLQRSAPSYHVALRFRGVEWMSGNWNGRTVLQTSGTGADLRRNLRLDGSFRARAVALAPEVEARTLTGTFAYAGPRGAPVLQFTGLEMLLAEGAYKGNGRTGADGRLHFDLSDGQKQLRWSATVSPFQLETAAAQAPLAP